MPFEQEQVSVKGSVRRVFGRESVLVFVRRRLPFMVALFAVEAGLLLAFSSLPMSQDQMQSYSTAWNQTATSISSLSPPLQVFAILGNNGYLALGMFTPVFGQISFLLSSYNTARVLDVIAFQSGVTSGGILLRLYLLPHTWIETFAYAVASGEGLYLVFALGRGWRRRLTIETVERELPRVVLSLAATGVLLVVAAVFEVGEVVVSSATEPAVAFLSWIPFAVLLGAAVFSIRGLARPPPGQQALIPERLKREPPS